MNHPSKHPFCESHCREGRKKEIGTQDTSRLLFRKLTEYVYCLCLFASVCLLAFWSHNNNPESVCFAINPFLLLLWGTFPTIASFSYNPVYVHFPSFLLPSTGKHRKHHLLLPGSSNRQKAGASPDGSGVSSGTTKDANGSSDPSAAASTEERSHPGAAPRSLAKVTVDRSFRFILILTIFNSLFWVKMHSKFQSFWKSYWFLMCFDDLEPDFTSKIASKLCPLQASSSVRRYTN